MPCESNLIYLTSLPCRQQKAEKIIHPSPLDDPLPGQKLRYHEVTDVLISPVGQVTGDAGPDSHV